MANFEMSLWKASCLQFLFSACLILCLSNDRPCSTYYLTMYKIVMIYIKIKKKTLKRYQSRFVYYTLNCACCRSYSAHSRPPKLKVLGSRLLV